MDTFSTVYIHPMVTPITIVRRTRISASFLVDKTFISSSCSFSSKTWRFREKNREIFIFFQSPSNFCRDPLKGVRDSLRSDAQGRRHREKSSEQEALTGGRRKARNRKGEKREILPRERRREKREGGDAKRRRERESEESEERGRGKRGAER